MPPLSICFAPASPASKPGRKAKPPLACWWHLSRGCTGVHVKPLYLPEGTTHVQYSELAHLIANALWPSTGPSDVRIAYGGARVNLDAELAQAVKAGALELKDPLTLGPHTFPVGHAMQSALVTVAALGAFVAPRGLTIEYARPHPHVVDKDELPNLPEFTMPVRMFSIDPLLLSLDPGSKVRYVSGLGASGIGNARDFIEESQKIIARQADGFFTVAEAAAILAESSAGGDAPGWREKMYAAWHTGDLIIRDTTRTKKTPNATKRDFMDLVKESDLDVWLEKDGAGYRFPRASAQDSPTLVEPISPASPRDFKPWETLPDFFGVIPGVYMYQQAAREIADDQGWDDGKLTALLAAMATAVNDGTLPKRNPKTGLTIPPNSTETLALVTVEDVNAWLEKVRAPYRWELQRAAEVVAHAVTGEIDFAMVATRKELIDAFGARTGMNDTWFKRLADRPGLRDARRHPGQGGRNKFDPLFCPYSVMQWLTTKPRRGDSRRQLPVETGWRLLQSHFMKVYNSYSSGDPREE